MNKKKKNIIGGVFIIFIILIAWYTYETNSPRTNEAGHTSRTVTDLSRNLK